VPVSDTGNKREYSLIEVQFVMVSELTVSEARADLGPVTSLAEYGGETTYLTKQAIVRPPR